MNIRSLMPLASFDYYGKKISKGEIRGWKSIALLLGHGIYALAGCYYAGTYLYNIPTTGTFNPFKQQEIIEQSETTQQEKNKQYNKLYAQLFEEPELQADIDRDKAISFEEMVFARRKMGDKQVYNEGDAFPKPTLEELQKATSGKYKGGGNFIKTTWYIDKDKDGKIDYALEHIAVPRHVPFVGDIKRELNNTDSTYLHLK